LQAVPTLANVLGYGGFWADQPDTGITWRKLVHAEQNIELFAPLPPQGRIVGTNRVVGLHDKGAAKGALLVQERLVQDHASGTPLVKITQTSMLRGDGGFGASIGAPLPVPHRVPERPADAVCEIRSLPQAALLYRLNGDFNPLHADPAVAQAAGFQRPILHGLCTMGIAMHAVLRGLLAFEAGRVRSMRVRFTSPVYPGELLRTELWRDGAVISLRSSVPAREATVLDGGRVELATP
jgi:acyl dehydratase